MLKKGKIDFSALLLLLIYIFSNIPFALMHQHNDHIVAYDKATSCEKSIYYGSLKNSCGHSAHIFKTIKHCKLCEKHLITPHIKENYIDYSIYITQYKKYALIEEEFIQNSFKVISNKGPPTV